MTTSLKVLQEGDHLSLGFENVTDMGSSALVTHADEIRHLTEKNNSSRVTFDFRNIRAITSSSIAILFALYRQGVAIELYEPSEAVRDVLKITRLQEVFQTTDTLPGDE